MLVLSFLASLALAVESNSVSLTPVCIENQAIENPTKWVEGILLEKKISDDEVLTRLVYAESLASNCLGGTEDDAIVQGIAWVVYNRVRSTKFGNGRYVATKPSQFQSSMGGYDVATRPFFLCPLLRNSDFWHSRYKKNFADQHALASHYWLMAVHAAAMAKANQNNPLEDVHHYYLGEHFKGSKLESRYYGKLPSWSNPPSVRVTPKLESLKPDSRCILFYRVR